MRGTAGKSLLASLAALAIAGCGGDEAGDGTIPRENAENLLTIVDTVDSLASAGECEAARDQVGDLTAAINQLPAETGEETKEAMREAAANLETQIADECDASDPPEREADTDTSTPSISAPTTTSSSTTTETETETEGDEDEADEDEEEPEPEPEGPGQGPPGGVPPGQEGSGGVSSDFEQGPGR